MIRHNITRDDLANMRIPARPEYQPGYGGCQAAPEIRASVHTGQQVIRSDPKNQLSGGFTLIELLVVITIIALLIAILLPVLSSAREASHQALCLARQRQFAIAFTTYTHDFNDYKPCAARENPTNAYSGLWVFQLGGPNIPPYTTSSYLPNARSFDKKWESSPYRCPAYTGPVWRNVYALNRSNGLSMHFRLYETTTLTSTASDGPTGTVGSLSPVWMFGCGNLIMWRRNKLPVPTNDTSVSVNTEWINLWHPSAPFVFLDGHGESLTFDFLVDTVINSDPEGDAFWGHNY